MSSAVSNRLSLTPSQGRPMSSPPPAVQVTQLRVMVVLSGAGGQTLTLDCSGRPGSKCCQCRRHHTPGSLSHTTHKIISISSVSFQLSYLPWAAARLYVLEISFIYEINIRIIKSFISILFTYEKTTGRVVNVMSILQTCLNFHIHAGHTLPGKLI